ncbi:MAG: dTDP-4-dehydrorhamnose 3,5-epimerase [Sulfurospirillaceae bacterium]|nr:dTDP-4-dehydrorhamnose 3,5-epimerase [Sulfurospirillaceae bacterium]
MGKLRLTELSLSGAYLIEPNKHDDHRGSFSRVFCQEEISQIFDGHIAQINHSITLKKGSIRGLHFQYPPNAEVKMVKCIKGSVFDVIVDIRQNSKTFLQWVGKVLSDKNMCMMYVPKGFAHGFQTLEDDTELLYLHSEVYVPKNESGLNVLDPMLSIDWPLPMSDSSKRDSNQAMIEKDFKGLVV